MLDFSQWVNQPPSANERMLICDAVSNGRMPLPGYTVIHRNAKLSKPDVESICQWAAAPSTPMTLMPVGKLTDHNVDTWGAPTSVEKLQSDQPRELHGDEGTWSSTANERSPRFLLRPSPSCELVAYSMDRLEAHRIGGLFLQLLAEAKHVCVDGTRGGIVVVTPHFVEQLSARDDPVLVVQEEA